MFRGRFFGFLVVMLLVVGLLGLAGSSIYRAGWTEGYFVGKVSDGAPTGESTVVVPEPVTRGDRGFSLIGAFFGTVLKCLFFLFLVSLVFKLIGLLMWRGGRRHGWPKHGGPGRWRHRGGWGKGHDHSPPWYDDGADEPMKA
jgi:hypothetical protein